MNFFNQQQYRRVIYLLIVVDLLDGIWQDPVELVPRAIVSQQIDLKCHLTLLSSLESPQYAILQKNWSQVDLLYLFKPRISTF